MRKREGVGTNEKVKNKLAVSYKEDSGVFGLHRILHRFFQACKFRKIVGGVTDFHGECGGFSRCLFYESTRANPGFVFDK